MINVEIEKLIGKKIYRGQGKIERNGVKPIPIGRWDNKCKKIKEMGKDVCNRMKKDMRIPLKKKRDRQ